MVNKHNGRCLCGEVEFEVTGKLRDVMYCHCEQCRKQTGHYFAATATKLENIEISGSENITWFKSSERAERGFCSKCGSALFWKLSDGSGHISILAGALDNPTGLKATSHIYCDQKGDYYELDDDLPKFNSYD